MLVFASDTFVNGMIVTWASTIGLHYFVFHWYLYTYCYSCITCPIHTNGIKYKTSAFPTCIAAINPISSENYFLVINEIIKKKHKNKQIYLYIINIELGL